MAKKERNLNAAAKAKKDELYLINRLWIDL